MSFISPIEDLYNQVKTTFVARGDSSRFLFGGANVAGQDRPPLYIWVPTRFTGESDRTQGRGATEYRDIATIRSSCTVHIRGASYTHCEAMLRNLWSAINAVQGVEARLDSGGFLRSDSGASFIQDGQVLEAVFSIRVALSDQVFDLSSLANPDYPTAVITAITGGIESSDTLTDPGEPLP